MSKQKPSNSDLSAVKAALLAKVAGGAVNKQIADIPDDEGSPVEVRLVALWSDAFGQAVGVHDDFFALGGDSILALRLAEQAQEVGLAMRGADMFSYPTIRQLAGQVSEIVPEALRPSSDIPSNGVPCDVPLTSMQQGMLYQCQRAGRGAAYVSQFTCNFAKTLDVKRMIAAWSKVAEARFCLNAGLFYLDDGQPVFREAKDMPLDVLRCDWREWDPVKAHEGLEVLASADRERGFDLERGTLSRLIFVHMPDETWHCIWSHHHLILDGWSQLILLQDCFSAYRTGVGAVSKDVGSIAEFASRQPEVLDAQARAYWADALAAARPTSFAPATSSSPATSKIDTTTATLPANISQALDNVAKHNKATRAALCEVIWALVLSSIFGADRVSFGRVNNTRPPKISGVESAWMFINTLPCAYHFAADKSLGELLQERQRFFAQLPDRVQDPLSAVLKHCPNSAFGSVLVQENFRLGVAETAQLLDSDIAPTDIAFHIAEHHPLVCVVGEEAKKICVEIKIDRSWDVPCTADNLVARFELIARSLAYDPQQDLLNCSSKARAISETASGPAAIVGKRRHVS